MSCLTKIITEICKHGQGLDSISDLTILLNDFLALTLTIETDSIRILKYFLSQSQLLIINSKTVLSYHSNLFFTNGNSWTKEHPKTTHVMLK